MVLKTSLTGSYPPIRRPEELFEYSNPEEKEAEVRQGTERAVQDQLELGIDCLVDGQVRDDIVALFVGQIPGFNTSEFPYRIDGKIKPAKGPITLDDFRFARGLAQGKPMKAHITGPMTIIRRFKVSSDSPYTGRDDPQLIDDLAEALAQEAHYLSSAGAEIIQIDEPVLQDGVDLDAAFRGMRRIVEVGKIPTPALHICGDVTKILVRVLDEAPVKIISMEGAHLRKPPLWHIDGKYLVDRDKQIGLGCIQVSSHEMDRITKVQHFLDEMVNCLGEEGIWAVMPNCGMRTMPHEIAKAKLKIMVDAVHSI